MLQVVNTILMVDSTKILLVPRQFSLVLRYPRISMTREKLVGDFQASSVVKAQDQKSGNQSSCVVRKSYFNT